MFVIKIKELFAPTLNEITASVRCVSSIIVVLNCGTHKQKTVRNEKARQECCFLLVEAYKHSTSIAVLTVHAKTSLETHI